MMVTIAFADKKFFEIKIIKKKLPVIVMSQKGSNDLVIFHVLSKIYKIQLLGTLHVNMLVKIVLHKQLYFK